MSISRRRSEGMKIIGWILLVLSAFMFVGYLGADVAGGSAIAALLITVVLPAAGGLALVTGRVGTSGKLSDRREGLRRQTLEAELLRLATRYAGRITIVEAVSELAVTPEEAKEALDALAVRGLADFEVTESGVIVYVFHDLEHLGEKGEAKGLLE